MACYAEATIFFVFLFSTLRDMWITVTVLVTLRIITLILFPNLLAVSLHTIPSLPFVLLAVDS